MYSSFHGHFLAAARLNALNARVLLQVKKRMRQMLGGRMHAGGKVEGCRVMGIGPESGLAPQHRARVFRCFRRAYDTAGSSP